MRKLCLSILSLLIIAAAVVSTSAQNGAIVNDEIHAAALEGNLVGDSPKRSVLVYLPPDYERQKKMRYPVIYLLHGFSRKGNLTWIESKYINVEIINRLIAEKKISPMIIVMPDGKNRYGGSMYTNSITTGNWEAYIVRDLVAYIDKKYRTLPNAESRGIAGHSMGGYGAIKLAMKNPDVFAAFYGTSSCCLNIFPGKNPTSKQMEEAAALKSFEEAEKAPFGVQVTFAYAASFSPNPEKPPFFSDYPMSIGSGDADAAAEYAQARWLANIPTYMVDQYLTNLRQLHAIAFDAGTKEPAIQTSSRRFSEILKRNKIKHTFEVFEGGHVDKVAERIETRILRFFSQELVSQTSMKKAGANKSK
jgi:enterochelin esterase-like enzyme